MIRHALLIAIVFSSFLPAVEASILFVTDDEAGFAVSASLTSSFLGVETFEESALADGGDVSLTSLSQTTTDAPFPSGILQPVTLSSTSGLTAWRNTGGVVSTVISTFDTNRTLVLSFDPTDNISAVGFNLVTPFTTVDTTATFTVILEGGLVSESSSIATNSLGSHYLGILTEPGDAPIASILLGNFSNGVRSGVDNISLYSAVPEPSTLTIALLLGTCVFLKNRVGLR